jgi:pyruvate kinase
MAMLGSVTPMMLTRVVTTDEMISHAEQELVRQGVATDGDGVVMVAGIPPNQSASTNLMKLHVVGSGDLLHPDSDV